METGTSEDLKLPAVAICPLMAALPGAVTGSLEPEEGSLRWGMFWHSSELGNGAGLGWGEQWVRPVPWNLDSLIDKATGCRKHSPSRGLRRQSGQPCVERAHLKD